MSLGTANRDGGKTSESGHLRSIQKSVAGEVLSGLAVSQHAAGANMSVDIAIGDAVIPRSDGTYGHPSFNDAVLNQAITTADPSNPRRDILVMYIAYGVTPSTSVSNNTNGVVAVKVVAGTPAGSPVDPTDSTIQSSVGSGNPFIKLARIRVGAGVTSVGNSVIDDLRTMAQSLENGGWTSLASAWDAWTYSAWDSTNKLGTINVPDSSILTLGQKVRYWQTTGGWKYGFIVKIINSTSILVFHGPNYTLNNERVYLPAYSGQQLPSGWPADPANWSFILVDTTERIVSSPTSGTWYNNGSLSVPLPIGLWDVEFFVQAGCSTGSATRVDSSACVSTSSSSASDADLIAGFGLGSVVYHSENMTRRKTITNASNATLYLLGRAGMPSMSGLYFENQSLIGSSAIIRARCAYAKG